MWLLTLFFLAFSESSEMLLNTTHHLALPLLRRMGVHAERHRCRGVTQHVLQRLYVRADGDRNGGQGVPLRFNYDTPEKHRRIKDIKHSRLHLPLRGWGGPDHRDHSLLYHRH